MNVLPLDLICTMYIIPPVQSHSKLIHFRLMYQLAGYLKKRYLFTVT